MSANSQSRFAPSMVLGMNEGGLGLLGVAILLMGFVFWSAHSPNVQKTDFSLTYVGAHIIHQGKGAQLYDLNLQKQVRDSLFQHPSPLFYEHPPFEALLLSPFAAVSFQTAYTLWGVLNATLLLLLIFFLRPYLPRPHEDLGYLSLWVLFAPLMVALYQGQSSLLVFSLYAMTYISLKEGKEFHAGMWLGFGLFKFQFILPFALIFIFRKKWRFLSGFASASLILGLLSLLSVGWTGIVTYVRLLLAISSNPQDLSYGSAVDMPTIYGFVYAVLGHIMGHGALNVTVLVLSILLLVFIARRWRSHLGKASDDLLFAAAIAASLLAGSHMFTHDFSPVLLGMFLAAGNLPTTTYRGLRITMIAVLVLFWAFPVYFLFVAWHCMYLMCPVLLLFALSAMFAAKCAGEDRLAEAQCVAGG